MSDPLTPRTQAKVLVLVMASGLASLAYQVIWDRMLRLAFGADDLGSVLVTSTFLLGLGLGAIVFGRRWRSPLRVYAAVEAAIGLFGLLSYPLLGGLAEGLSTWLRPSLAQAEGLRVMSALGVLLFLSVPSILMGGTLPLIFACFVGPGRTRTSQVGLLYGANTVGAMLGVALPPLSLLAALRVPAALGVIAAINFAVALVLWREAVKTRAPVLDEDLASPRPLERPPVTLYVAAFASGALVLAWELLALRHLGHLHAGSPYNFSLVLLLYLAGLAAGSLFLCRGASADRALRRLPLLFAGGALALGLSLLIGGSLLTRGGLSPASVILSASSGSLSRVGLYLAVLLLPFAILQGAVFPSLLAVAAPTGSALPQRTGPLYLASALGSFTAGLTLYQLGWDHLGARGVALSLIAVGVALALWLGRKQLGGERHLGAYGLAALAVAVAAVVPQTSWRILAFGWQGLVPSAQLTAMEGRTGTAVVSWFDADRQHGAVWIHGKPFGEVPETPTWVWAASLVRAQPMRARVLMLGLGTGTALRELVQDPGVTHIDMVDWSEEIPRLLTTEPLRSTTGWALSSAKVRLIRTDARTAVTLAEAGAYDVVFESLTGYGPVGSTHYRSREYYRQLRRILSPGGALVVVGLRLDDRVVAAAALESFSQLRWFPPMLAVLSDHVPAVDPLRLREALAERPRLGDPTELIAASVELSREALSSEPPVRDDSLFGEYTIGPLARRRR